MEEKREELGTRQKACGDKMERDNKNPDLPSTNPSTTSALGLPSSLTYDHHLSIPSEFQSHALPSHVKYKNCRDVNIRVLLYNKAPMKSHMCPSTLFGCPWGNHGCDRGTKPRGSSHSLFLSSGTFRPQSRNQKQFQLSMLKCPWCAQDQTEQSLKTARSSLGVLCLRL